jgi:hypothetical protein
MPGMQKAVFLSLILALSFFPSPAPADPNGRRPVPAGLNHASSMQPEGDFGIRIRVGDQWRTAGSLTFDRFLREMTLDLGPFVSDGIPVTVRLTQRGGSAAHVDAVLLGGLPPEGIEGNGTALAAISARDLDLQDAFQADWILRFQPTGADRTLRLTARIEGERKSAIPFHFPPANRFKTIHEKSEFYSYALQPASGGADVPAGDRGPLRGKPLFEAYSRAASGHPSGTTYGWVANDASDLRVRIDFTPDNTMDGDRDYATVYVNTPGGVRAFKVTEGRTRWGKPSFVSTEKAAYRHKVYDFKIPLREIGLTAVEQGRDIQLAFAAYGTAEPGDYVTDTAFDPYSERYLSVIDKYGKSAIDVYAQMVDCNGSPYGGKFPVGDGAGPGSSPSAAFDTASRRYLVVWMDGRNSAATGGDIYGQFVSDSGQLENRDGTPGTENFVISNAPGNQFDPSVAYDSVNGRFFIVWMDERNVSPWTTGRDIYGQIIYSNGASYGPPSTVNFPVCNEPEEQRGADVAYDAVHQRFLVAWQDDRNATGNPQDRDIFGQLINAGGTLYGTASNANFAICTAAKYQSPPHIAYSSLSQKFLLVWADYRIAGGYDSGDIYGQAVNADGSLSGPDIAVSASEGDQTAPALDFNPATGEFLVAWWHKADGAVGNQIYGQYLDSEGALSGTNFPLVSGDLDPGQYGLTVTANPLFFHYMLAFDMTDGTLPDIGFLRLGPPCADGFGDELAVDFGPWGAWDYDGMKWVSVTPSNPETMASWAGGLAMDFGVLGLWNYDGSGWQSVSGADAEGMTGWQGGVAMDFGALGLWNYDGLAVAQLSAADAQRMAAWYGGLALDLGALGLWNYDGTVWQVISGGGLAGMAGWPGGLAVDFGSLGLWTFDGVQWRPVSGAGVQGMTGWTGGLALDFGALGLWNYDGTDWQAVSSGNTDAMAGWRGGLALDYGALGLWNYNGIRVDFLSGADPESMVGVDLIHVIYAGP